MMGLVASFALARWRCERSGGEAASEHRVSALRLLLRSFVLDDVPVLGETTAFESYDVDDDPSGGQADAGKAPVEHHVIAIGNRQGVLVAHRGWQAPDEREKTLTPRRNVGAMLDVVWRPVLLGRHVVPSVEQGFECLEDEGLVPCLLLCVSTHGLSPFSSTLRASSGAGARRGPLICGRCLRPRGCASLEKECHGVQLARSTNPAEVRHRRVQEREATDRGAEREAQIHEGRSEEHTSELQSPCNLVCRLLLEKKKKKKNKKKKHNTKKNKKNHNNINKK